MTAKRRELLARFDKRTKDLQQFLDERGDNITAADYQEATKIRDDLKSIRTEIDNLDVDEELRSDLKGAQQFLSGAPQPGTRNAPAHQAAQVVGSANAGDVTLKRKGRVWTMLRQNGPGVFGGDTFRALSSREYREGFKALFRGNYRSPYFRNLEEGLDPQGGYLSPIEVIAKLIQRKPTPTNVQDLVDMVNTTRDAVVLPRVNYSSATDDSLGQIYTTGFRATLTDENPTSDTQAQVTDTNIFGTARVPVYTWMIEGVLTNNMVEDAMFDPITWMSDKFVETVRLLRDNMILNGVGGNQPIGILANPGGDGNQPTVVNSGSGVSPYLTPDGIVSISEDVPEQYDDNCRFIFKKTTTGKTIRQFKDANGRYLFGEGYQDSGLVPGRKRVLNGYPTVFSQFMPDPAANAYPIIFGDLMGGTLVNRIGFSVQLLREIAARRNQIIVLGRVRFGFQVLEPWRLRVQKCSA